MTAKTETVRLAAYLKAKPGEEAALAQALSKLALAVREEPGCIEYVPHAVAGQPGEFMFYEVWESQAALDAHAAGANLKAMEAPFARILAEPAKLVFLQRLA
ncbi:putative quinol monooxygenase [Radicibacter daui]|uniref:putative quinol monooxygenase n=1 Tax=Radicibacter daui TaxID=3064829 RepID=UPI004046D8C0